MTTIYRHVSIDYGAAVRGSATPFTFPQYRLLIDHYLKPTLGQPGEVLAGSIINEGTDVPVGWIPTLAVEPLNASAATNYYNAGPRDLSQGTTNDTDIFTGSWQTPFRPTVQQPKTFWTQVRGSTMFQLTGLGAGFPPRM